MWPCNVRFRTASIRRDARGAMAVQVAALFTLLMAMGVIGIDFGRMVVLKSQMQNAADAAATAGAAQLDGLANARARADAVARQAAVNASTLPIDTSDFVIARVTFYADYPTRRLASGDTDALAVEVTLRPKTLSLMLMPVLNLLAESDGATVADLEARAVAQNAPLICDMPPLMICDPAELAGGGRDPAKELTNPANIGRQMVIQGEHETPGNFGLLCPQDGSNCGASAIGQSLAQPNPNRCQSVFLTTFDTATGRKLGPITDGINSRFNIGSPSMIWQAPNIVSYGRDSRFASTANQNPTVYGGGDWNPSLYWSNAHGGAPLPAALGSGATRYQAYLYELGATFARNGAQTLYPAPAFLPSGFSLIVPPGADMPTGGTPSPANRIVSDPRRRLVKAVVMQCLALNIRGSHTYPSSGRYAEFFITEPVGSSSNNRVLGELVGVVNAQTSEQYHGNVRLLD